MPLRFRRWWWLGPNGKAMLDVGYRARRLEIKPKKATVEVGELDAVLLAAREGRVGTFRRSGS